MSSPARVASLCTTAASLPQTGTTSLSAASALPDDRDPAGGRPRGRAGVPRCDQRGGPHPVRQISSGALIATSEAPAVSPACRAAALAANNLVVSTVMPATTAQVSASPTLTVVSVGSVGGVLPVARVHTTVSSLRATNTAPAVTSVPIRRLPPLFLAIRSPPRLRAFAPSSHGLAAVLDRRRYLRR